MPWRNRSPAAADLGMLDMGIWTSADVNNFAAFSEGVDLSYPSAPTSTNTHSSANNSRPDSFGAMWDGSSPNLNGSGGPMDNDRPLFPPIEGQATTWYDPYGAHNQGAYARPSTSPTYPPPSYLGSIYNFQPARNSQLELLEGVSLRDMTVEDPNEYTLLSNDPLQPHELKQEPYLSMPPNLLRYPSETTSASLSGSGHSVSPSALAKPSNKRDSEDEDGEQTMNPNHPAAKVIAKRRRKSAITSLDTTGSSSASHPPAVRNRHNLIEKRYRDSLQTRLLRLAQVLPSSKVSTSANATEHEISSTENSKRKTTTSAGRRKSSTTTAPGATEPQLKKAHILDEAVSYIETLEKRMETMEVQNRVLNETLKGVYELIQQTWPETAEKILGETGLILPELSEGMS